MDGNLIILALIGIFSPIIGGLIKGVDRKITAKMQSRIGPPIVQPFYDVIKLLSKREILTNSFQALFVWSHLILMVTTLVLFLSLQDMLTILFVWSFADICLVLAAMSVRSPFGHIGSLRELFQILSFEPIFFMLTISFYLITGSFMLNGVVSYGGLIIKYAPGIYLALLVMLPVKFRKSPFDISASQHAHQEIVSGLFTDLSGPYLAICEFSHWIELVLLLALLTLFWTPNIYIGISASIFVYFATIVVDNATSRLTIGDLLRTSWVVAGIAALNIILLALWRFGLWVL
jgi:formate hydrogenlyase subunit 4